MEIDKWDFTVYSSPLPDEVNHFVVFGPDNKILGAFNQSDPNVKIALAVGRLNDPFHIGRSDWGALKVLPQDFRDTLELVIHPPDVE